MDLQYRTHKANSRIGNSALTRERAKLTVLNSACRKSIDPLQSRYAE